jgi:hypothetical protein
MDSLPYLFYFCIFSSVAPPPLFPLVFCVREGLTGCASVMHVPSFCLEVLRSIQPSRCFCISRRPPRRWLTRGQSSVVDTFAISDNNKRCQEGDYSRSAPSGLKEKSNGTTHFTGNLHVAAPSKCSLAETVPPPHYLGGYSTLQDLSIM